MSGLEWVIVRKQICRSMDNLLSLGLYPYLESDVAEGDYELLYWSDGSFPKMACDYIHATGMTEEEVGEMLEAMKHLGK